MRHGDHEMAMTTWPVRFDGAVAPLEPAPLLGEHTKEALSEWLGLDDAAIAELKQAGAI
jgi:crotonobetainyl-CoA:carnitine CoA-transferase CaiB-like acyl-CoA transferase